MKTKVEHLLKDKTELKKLCPQVKDNLTKL